MNIPDYADDLPGLGRVVREDKALLERITEPIAGQNCRAIASLMTTTGIAPISSAFVKPAAYYRNF